MSKRGRAQFVGKVGRSAVLAPAFSSPTLPRKDHPYGKEWPRISLEIKKRDNYTCQAHHIGLPRCGNRYPPPFHHLLESHHVIPYAQVRVHNKKWIVCLCADCHQQAHGRGWRKNSITLKQKLAASRLQ